MGEFKSGQNRLQVQKDENNTGENNMCIDKIDYYEHFEMSAILK